MYSDDEWNIDSGNVSSEEEEEEELSYPFEVLNTEEIAQHMAECINEVASVVDIPATITRILLNHFRWDKDRLIEKFYDTNREELFKSAHIESCPAITFHQPVTEECGVCFTHCDDMTSLQCAHRFCTSCWLGYLTVKIMDEGLCKSIPCIAYECENLVDDATVMSLVTDPAVRTKYQRLITKSFVECNRLLNWCPSPHCDFVIKVPYVEASPVSCSCGYIFCFKCSEQWHEPVSCQLLRKWIKKCNDSSETYNWMVVNTKDCPKCNVPIEKNGGCNHMTCRKTDCECEFCWVCLGSWQEHQECNRYIETHEAQEKLRTFLERYLHFYNRYSNHLQSLKFENKLFDSVEVKMETIQKQNVAWIETQFLKEAVEVLCRCRKTLMYTYVFAYYLERNYQSEIFEDNQAFLESATEALSELLEHDTMADNLEEIKMKVQQKNHYCERQRKLLVNHVNEGYERELWAFMQ